MAEMNIEKMAQDVAQRVMQELRNSGVFCNDCISRVDAMRAITDEWVRGKHTLEGFTAAIYNLPPVTPERAESEGEG